MLFHVLKSIFAEFVQGSQIPWQAQIPATIEGLYTLIPNEDGSDLARSKRLILTIAP
jgi:hypothetical protein